MPTSAAKVVPLIQQIKAEVGKFPQTLVEQVFSPAFVLSLDKTHMQYFIRTVERKKDNARRLAPKVDAPPPTVYPDIAFSDLGGAMGEAKRIVMESDRSAMLQSEACFLNRNQVRIKYRCWIDERGGFVEYKLG